MFETADCFEQCAFIRDSQGNFIKLSGIQTVTTVSEIEEPRYDMDVSFLRPEVLSFTMKLTKQSYRRLRKMVSHDINPIRRKIRLDIRHKEKERRRRLKDGKA